MKQSKGSLDFLTDFVCLYQLTFLSYEFVGSNK